VARRSKVVTIDWGTPETNRDHGKQFLIREMSADAAERWAIRVLLAFANAGAKLPDSQLMSGLEHMAASYQALMIQGIRSLAGMRYEDVEPLLAQMLACVTFKPPQAGPVDLSTESTMSQIEEVKTILRLRYEVLELHLGFSLADALSNSTASPAATAPASA
jgi:hypothetical protein